MKKYTQYLFLISAILSLYSLVSVEKGGREFYPFFGWKLFTVPYGANELESDYRLYAIKEKDTIRLSFSNDETLFHRNQKAKIVSYYAKVIKNGKVTDKDMKALKSYAKLMYKDADEFLLVEEQFNPKDLCDKNRFSFKKQIITSIR